MDDVHCRGWLEHDNVERRGFERLVICLEEDLPYNDTKR